MEEENGEYSSLWEVLQITKVSYPVFTLTVCMMKSQIVVSVVG